MTTAQEKLGFINSAAQRWIASDQLLDSALMALVKHGRWLDSLDFFITDELYNALQLVIDRHRENNADSLITELAHAALEAMSMPDLLAWYDRRLNEAQEAAPPELTLDTSTQAIMRTIEEGAVRFYVNEEPWQTVLAVRNTTVRCYRDNGNAIYECQLVDLPDDVRMGSRGVSPESADAISTQGFPRMLFNTFVDTNPKWQNLTRGGSIRFLRLDH